VTAPINNPVSPTLDVLFQRTLARQPHALALIDPGNKLRVTGQLPRRLTYAEADRAISALASHFIEAGLPANAVVAIQLPNTIEFVLTVLAAQRVGLVVAILPLLWRQAELTAALNRTAARAIVTTSKIDGVIYSDLAMNAAAEAFSIRHVCGFGSDLPEGMAPLDDIMTRDGGARRAIVHDGRKAAIISFDVTADGFRPVPRPHYSLVAAGLAISMESGFPPGATVMSAFAPMSFAGLASSLAVWLLKGFIDEIPREYEEAALVDGYTRLQAFVKVVLPQAITGIAATAIFCLIFAWNEYAFALLLTSGDAQTMPPFIPFIIGEGGQDWPAVAAATTLFVLPILIFTVVLRKHLLRGITFGAVRK